MLPFRYEEGEKAVRRAAFPTIGLSMKVLCGMALRQMSGFVESLLRLIGVNRAVPGFSTLSRRQKRLAVTIPRIAVPEGRCTC